MGRQLAERYLAMVQQISLEKQLSQKTVRCKLMIYTTTAISYTMNFQKTKINEVANTNLWTNLICMLLQVQQYLGQSRNHARRLTDFGYDAH